MKKPPVTAIVILAIFGIFTGFIVYLSYNPPPGPYDKMSSRDLAQVCMASEGTVLHIHSHLTIIANKQTLTVPAEIGIDAQNNCIHPLHTHDDSGIIHIESPVQKDFILGDFFEVWGMTFNQNQILDNKTDANHGLKISVNGKESGDFENTVLKDHADIVIDYYNLKDGPDPLPKPFDWSTAQV